jgi:hypothetical protein
VLVPACCVLQVQGKDTLVMAHINCTASTYGTSYEQGEITGIASSLEGLMQGHSVLLQSSNQLPGGSGGSQGNNPNPVEVQAGTWPKCMLSPLHVGKLVSDPWVGMPLHQGPTPTPSTKHYLLASPY